MSANDYFPVPADEGATCSWLVEVANGNPEPDFPSDCYDIVECGAPLERNVHWSWRCEAGHSHVCMEDPARAEFELVLIAEERGW
jgi:hypothetical protein